GEDVPALKAQAAHGGGSDPARGSGDQGAGRGFARLGHAPIMPARRPWLLAHPWRCCSLTRRDTAPARRDTITGTKVGFLGAGGARRRLRSGSRRRCPGRGAWLRPSRSGPEHPCSPAVAARSPLALLLAPPP